MTCASCGFELQPVARFCPKCGRAVKRPFLRRSFKVLLFGIIGLIAVAIIWDKTTPPHIRESARKARVESERAAQAASKQVPGPPAEPKAALIAPPAPPPTGKWQVGKGSSSFDDSTTVMLMLSAENSISGWPFVTHTPMLILRCQERKTEAYINVGMQGKPEFGEYGAVIGVGMRARYDKGRVYEYMMGKSTDGEALFFPTAIEEIKTMLNHDSMVAQFTPFNSSPVEFRFELAGLPEAIKPLRKTCGW